jgi:hypothetical protein
MDLGGVLSATAHLISDSAAWRVPSESDANVDVARGTLPPARWTSGANVGPPPPPRVPTLAADVGRQGGRCTSHLTPPTLPRYLGKVLPCRYIRPLLLGRYVGNVRCRGPTFPFERAFTTVGVSVRAPNPLSRPLRPYRRHKPTGRRWVGTAGMPYPPIGAPLRLAVFTH